MLAAGALALSACSVLPPTLPEDPARELGGVPFFPQTIHQCGPAALATVLGWSGMATTPEALALQVYIPGRKGSLALELVAATRRAGRMPWQLRAEEDVLLGEVQAGMPVLVLQDLGTAGMHWWHYAVIVGYDPDRELVILRSGRERRRLESRHRFMASWRRGGGWAMLALPLDRLPASTTPEDVVHTIENSRDFLPAGASLPTYAAAVGRWPGDTTILFAAANDAYGSSRLDTAGQFYRALLTADPHHAAGLNNYANLLIELGCPAAAIVNAHAAMEALERDTNGDGRFRAAVEDTLSRAREAASNPPAAPAGCPPVTAAGSRAGG